MPRKGAAFDDRVYPRIVLFYSPFFASCAGRVHSRSGIERRWSASVAGGRPQDQPAGAAGGLFQRWPCTIAGQAPFVGDAGTAHLWAGAGIRRPERSRAVALGSVAGAFEWQAGTG